MLDVPCEVASFSWFSTMRQGSHVGGQYNTKWFHRIGIKIEFSSQRTDRLLFLTTNTATTMSHANQQ